MSNKFTFNLILSSIFIFGSSLAMSADQVKAQNSAESECSRLLQGSAYPGLEEEHNDGIIKEMKAVEKNSGSCAALNIFHCLTGNPNCKK